MATCDTPGNETTCCKVGRLCREYGLDDLDAELIRRWTDSDSDGGTASLRQLQRDLNRRLIRNALADSSDRPLDGEAENLRRLLRSNEVSSSERITAERRLERTGIDVEHLTRDFVSHQTVHNHLRDCLDVSCPTDSAGDRVQQARRTIFSLQNRTQTVTAQTLDRLAPREGLAPGEFDVLVDIQVICEQCGRSHTVDDLLEAGACDCV